MLSRFWSRRALRVGETKAPELKASAAGPLVSLHVQGRPRWSPRDYGAMARQGFMVNPVVHRAVRMIAEAAAEAPLLLFENGKAVETHPLLDLLARPNPAQGGASLMEAAFAGLLISGNAYVEAVRLDGRVRELFVLGEEREMYALEILDGAAVMRRVELDAPVFVYDAATQAADWGGPAPSPLSVRVAQVSPRFGTGAWRAAELNF